MGDRCQRWQAWVHIEDFEVFMVSMDGHVACEEQPRFDQRYLRFEEYKVVYILDHSVNYGAFTQCEFAAQNKCRFIVEHSAGGDYGPSAFVGWDGKMEVAYLDHDGRLVVAVAPETGIPLEADLESMKKFADMRNKVLDSFSLPKDIKIYDLESL